MVLPANRRVDANLALAAARACSALVLVFISQSVKQENLRKFPSVDCSTMADVGNQTLVVQDVLWEKYNQTIGNTGRLECFCKNLFLGGYARWARGAGRWRVSHPRCLPLPLLLSSPCPAVARGRWVCRDVTGVLNVAFPEPDLSGSLNWCVTWMETFLTNSVWYQPPFVSTSRLLYFPLPLEARSTDQHLRPLSPRLSRTAASPSCCSSTSRCGPC